MPRGRFGSATFGIGSLNVPPTPVQYGQTVPK